MNIKSIEYKDTHNNPVIINVGGSVDEIIEHTAKGEGDKWFYDVYYNDGTITRLFDVTLVRYYKI